MEKSHFIFGWKVALNNYGWKDFIIDSVGPIIISLALCVLMYIKNVNVFEQLNHLVDIGISIIPTLVALILTAYAIIRPIAHFAG